MAWEVNIKHRDEQIVSKWTGGTTTELAIYPPNGSYKERDFLWRISTAIVEDDKSVFTSLPAYNRIIMPLKGEILKLHHQNHYDKELQLVETDTFHGSWTTSSEGKVQDFNLMFTDACDGCMQGYRITRSLTINTEAASLSGNGEVVTTALYVLDGGVKASVATQHIELNLVDGDFVTFTGSIKEKPLIISFTVEDNRGKVIVACTTVRHNK